MLFELMCWCWSERPGHRPDFSTILDTLKSDMFSHLLASFPLLRAEEEVTTSCMRLCRTRRGSTSASLSSNSTSLTHSTILDQSLSTLGISSLIYGKSGTLGGEETVTQVWYGTEFGKYGMIQFQNSGILHEVCWYTLCTQMLCQLRDRLAQCGDLCKLCGTFPY